jgi:hypothetical protein
LVEKEKLPETDKQAPKITTTTIVGNGNAEEAEKLPVAAPNVKTNKKVVDDIKKKFVLAPPGSMFKYTSTLVNELNTHFRSAKILVHFEDLKKGELNVSGIDKITSKY